MSSENIIFAMICWSCSSIFGVIAIWAFKRKDPMHFWSGSTVRPDEIEDIPSYNRANGMMWAVYTIGMVVTGILSLFNITIGAILLGIICVPGVVVLIVVYNGIYNKYKSASVTNKTNASRSKIPKAVIVAITSFSAIILMVVGVQLYNGEKDPDISILDDRIQINTMYGLDIGISEIAGIYLLEKSMSDIGIGVRTNGYGGMGGAFKGNFKSDTLGETLLFVYSKSSPTIKIERTNKKDIYISFRNSEKTEQLYNKLIHFYNY